MSFRVKISLIHVLLTTLAFLVPTSLLVWGTGNEIDNYPIYFSALIGLILVSLLLARASYGPIERLIKLVRSIESGDSKAKIKLGSGKDLVLIAEWLNKLIDSASKANLEVERDIAERTKELEKSKKMYRERASESERIKQATVNLLEDLDEERRKLAESKAKVEAMLAGLGDGLIATDNMGRIMMVNPYFTKILGWTREEVIGKEFSSIITKVDPEGKAVEKEKRFINQVLKSGKTISTELNSNFSYKKKDNSLVPVAITISPIMLEGKVIGAVEVFRDITHEKEIDRVKTEFVSLASHQLRTPLSTINWYTEILMDQDAGTLNEEQKKYLDAIYKGNQRMVALVNALLDTSRLELGTFTVEPEMADMAELLKDVVQEQEVSIRERKMNVEKEIQPDMPEINVDVKLMRMVFQNLLSNAIKYTPEGGRVNLSLKLNDGKLHFAVKDTGYGIPKEQHGRIFEKLFRADNVKERDTVGSGLGLYIIKEIVDHSGGKIWFESVEEKGTTFHVELPLEGMKAKEGSKKLGG